MPSRGLRIGSALVCIVAIPAIAGCAHGRRGPADGRTSAAHQRKYPGAPGASSKCKHCQKPGCPGCMPASQNGRMRLTSYLPADAQSGECYASVYVPPQFDTTTERVVVREKSEKIEVVPAEYEWVEERILVKEAHTELVEVPAQFDAQERVVETSPGHSTWVKAQADRCAANTNGPPPQDVFCLVSGPATTMTLQTQRLVKDASVKEVAVPAEYQTVRRHKLVRPATTRRVTVPAEYREVKKTVMVSPAKVDWQRVNCPPDAYQNRPEFRPVKDNNP